MARRALLVGINKYDNFGPEAQLSAPVNDARRLAALLSIHADGRPNYDCYVLTSDTDPVTKVALRKALGELLRGSDDDALFYFSGHGVVTDSGGYIVTQDSEDYDEGILMDELLTLANKAKEREVIIILDCCMSGRAGDPTILQTNGVYERSLLRQNVAILAASRATEVAYEEGEHGLFTGLLIAALEGSATDFLGNISLPSVYGIVEGALGPWEQRPIYKSYVTSVSILRRAAPGIDLPSLRRITEIFPVAEEPMQLDPEFEYDKVPVTDKQVIGELLKRLRDVRLIEPVVPGQQLYWIAQESGFVRLTGLGRHYWDLVNNARI